MSTVLVTGGSGFVGSRVILKLLEDGHRVRSTVRSDGKQATLHAMLRNGGRQSDEDVQILHADLSDDRGWDSAVSGCDYVLHIASPFPPGIPKDENDLIVPARDGALRVLRAARNAGVKRVVLTSSFAAIGYGHGKVDTVFNEEDWTDLTGPHVQPYIKSKTVAERAAWDFVEREGGRLELSVINPVGIFGPVLGPDLSSSIKIIKGLLEGMPAVPRIYFSIVDVRDLAQLQVKAMLADVAKGERFLAVGNGVVSLLDVATMLRRHLGASASRVPTRQFPDWLLHLMAPFNPQAKAALPQLGIIRSSTSDKAHRLLDWTPRPYDETLTDTAESLLRFGIVKAR
jgi:dihydroflavonol-4-reductase